MNNIKDSNNVISSIGIAPAKYSFSQEKILDYMQEAYNDETANRKLNILFKQSGVIKRHSVVPDFDKSFKSPVLFRESKVPDVGIRMGIYKENALPLAIKAIDNAFDNINHVLDLTDVTHLITVSCTGLYAPGLGTELIEHYKLNPTTFHTAVNFMGCNAAFTAMRIADTIASSDNQAIILMVCVELCTLHFKPTNNSDNLLANTIFADGAAAAIISSAKRVKNVNYSKFEIGGFQSFTLKEGKKLMEWNINQINFEMILSSDIPVFIGNSIKNIFEQLSKQFNLMDSDDLQWAVHPGGKKILDTIKNKLELDEGALLDSYNILENFGNMSSVTILFVLHRLINNVISGKPIICLGFGPGISIESALLNRVVKKTEHAPSILKPIQNRISSL